MSKNEIKIRFGVVRCEHEAIVRHKCYEPTPKDKVINALGVLCAIGLLGIALWLDPYAFLMGFLIVFVPIMLAGASND